MHPIARYRVARGWTQAELAAAMEVSVTAVQGWERGAQPRPRMLVRLSEALRVDSLALLKELEDWRSTKEAGNG